MLKEFDSLCAVGGWQQAEKIGRAIREARVVFDTGEEELLFLDRMQGLAVQLGRIKDAEHYCLKTMELLEQMDEKNSPRYLATVHTLSLMYYHQGKYREALDAMIQALPAREAANLPDTTLGYDYFYLGQSLAANGYMDQAMIFLEKSHQLLAHSSHNLQMKFDICISQASGYSHFRQADQAKVWADRAIQIAEGWKGRNSVEYAIALNRLGESNYMQGNVLLAEQQWLRALTTMRSDPASGIHLLNLVKRIGMYSVQGDYEKAEAFFAELTQTLDQMKVKEYRPVEYAALYNGYYIDHLLCAQQYDRAVDALREMLAIYDRNFDNNNPQLLGVQELLDSVLALKNKALTQ